MKPLCSALLLAAVVLAGLPGCKQVAEFDATSRNTGRSFLGLGPQSKATGLTIALDYSPKPLRLAQTRQLSVTVAIRNDSKRQQSLMNETGQRIELLLREPGTGRILTRWSESRSFDTRLTSSLINPGESLSYSEKLSTRDLKSGGTYELVAFVPGQENRLKAVVSLTVE